MSKITPFNLLVNTFAGWLNGQQLAVIDYLVAENRRLKEQRRAVYHNALINKGTLR